MYSYMKEHQDKKYYCWTITIHNVQPQDITKPIVMKWFKPGESTEWVMSVEPYPEGPGQHLHVFIQYRNQHYFNPILKLFQELSPMIQAPKPPGETRDWGRVELDKMNGTFKEATAYLRGETKDKPLGEISAYKHELRQIDSECTIYHRAHGLPYAMYVPSCPSCQRLNIQADELAFICAYKW